MNGKPKKLLVHRKGSTRAFPPHHPLIPVDYQVCCVSIVWFWLLLASGHMVVVLVLMLMLTSMVKILPWMHVCSSQGSLS